MAAKRVEGAKGSRRDATPAPYVVFARRFRPQSFSDVVGQQTVTAALRQALKTGRLAQAYLLGGPRGIGKTSLARILAKAVNCLQGQGPGGVAEEPCNECEACEAIQNGSALDVIEMDAATNRGINEIRELRENVGLSPSQFRFKVYIVDEVHMLTQEAWNAFLKTLEEPPAHVKFIFATTDADKIPETILSRCQRFDLRRIGLSDIVKRLKKICAEEKIEATSGALERIAGLSKGGLRDAEGLLDQAVNLGEGKVDDEIVRRISGAVPDEMLFELLHACAGGQAAEALGKAGAALEAGADPDDLLVELCERLRGTLIAKTCGPGTSLLEGQSHLADAFAQLGEKLSEDQLLMLLQLFSSARRQVKDAAQARLPLEMALVRASRARDLVDLGKLVSALEAGTAIPGGTPRAAPVVAEGPRTYAARDGPRPNSDGRQEDAGSVRPAAGTTLEAGPLAAALPAPAASVAPERWDELLAAARPLPGGAIIAGALTHARGVKLDLEAGALELAFTPAQGFYRESLERPERLAALCGALTKVYGRAVQVAFARVEERAAPPVAAPSVRDVPDPEVEFDDEGALPLAAPEAARAAQPAERRPHEEAATVLRPESAPLPAAEAPAAPVAASQVLEGEAARHVLDHPLVKALVERVDGEVVRVERRKTR